MSFHHDSWNILVGLLVGIGYYALSWGRDIFYHSYLHGNDFMDKARFPFNKLSLDRKKKKKKKKKKKEKGGI